MARAGLRLTVILVACLAVMTAACTSGSGWPEPQAAPVNPAPVGLHIPTIDVSVDEVMGLAVDDNGAVEVPPVDSPELLGWYTPGPGVGEAGPTVLLGHVNGGGLDGVFARLHELAPGDDIQVPTSTGTTTYQVDRVQTIDKTDFPTRDVYGDTDRDTLRLVTCGGTWDPVAESYEAQVIVYATEA
ncbi:MULTISPECIES: sortase domain-containing protein [Pseudonocardia]|uniref:sortase domain-containing protein n=1 Tax=Pseudonocardia TaxID=1847 RepID=UPI000F7771C3|nr:MULTISPECIES: sortase [Pseudonocardia]